MVRKRMIPLCTLHVLYTILYTYKHRRKLKKLDEDRAGAVSAHSTPISSQIPSLASHVPSTSDKPSTGSDLHDDLDIFGDKQPLTDTVPTHVVGRQVSGLPEPAPTQCISSPLAEELHVDGEDADSFTTEDSRLFSASDHSNDHYDAVIRSSSE